MYKNCYVSGATWRSTLLGESQKKDSLFNLPKHVTSMFQLRYRVRYGKSLGLTSLITCDSDSCPFVPVQVQRGVYDSENHSIRFSMIMYTYIPLDCAGLHVHYVHTYINVIQTCMHARVAKTLPRPYNTTGLDTPADQGKPRACNILWGLSLSNLGSLHCSHTNQGSGLMQGLEVDVPGPVTVYHINTGHRGS
jgi:hypothetical protein